MLLLVLLLLLLIPEDMKDKADAELGDLRKAYIYDMIHTYIVDYIL